MPKITALSNIKHDGEDYVAGDSFTVNESDAEWLIKLGAAEAGSKPAKKAKEVAETATPEVDPADGSDATTA
jgi:hypothetical protein